MSRTTTSSTGGGPAMNGNGGTGGGTGNGSGSGGGGSSRSLSPSNANANNSNQNGTLKSFNQTNVKQPSTSQYYPVTHNSYSQFTRGGQPQTRQPQRSPDEHTKTIYVQASTFRQKTEHTFTADEFENWRAAKKLRGLVQIAPNPSSDTIHSWGELDDGAVYRKSKYSYLDQKLGLSDAGFIGVRYTVDNLVPPLLEFLYELNFTVKTSILNEGADKLAITAQNLFNNTILRQRITWNYTLDIILFVGAYLEVHFCMEGLRADPLNIGNFIALIFSTAIMYNVFRRRWSIEPTKSRSPSEDKAIEDSFIDSSRDQQNAGIAGVRTMIRHHSSDHEEDDKYRDRWRSAAGRS